MSLMTPRKGGGSSRWCCPCPLKSDVLRSLKPHGLPARSTRPCPLAQPSARSGACALRSIYSTELLPALLPRAPPRSSSSRAPHTRAHRTLHTAHPTLHAPHHAPHTAHRTTCACTRPRLRPLRLRRPITYMFVLNMTFLNILNVPFLNVPDVPPDVPPRRLRHARPPGIRRSDRLRALRAGQPRDTNPGALVPRLGGFA